MLIWNDVDAVPMDWPASVVTIGVFDGVHRGHRELIRHAVSRAAVLGVPSVVVTFWPNPAEILRAGDPPARLATLEQRLALIDDLGIDAVLVLPFSHELSLATPEQFAGSSVTALALRRLWSERTSGSAIVLVVMFGCLSKSAEPCRSV